MADMDGSEEGEFRNEGCYTLYHLSSIHGSQDKVTIQ